MIRSNPRTARIFLLLVAFLIGVAILLVALDLIQPRVVLWRVQHEGTELVDRTVHELKFTLKPKVAIPLDPSATPMPIRVEESSQASGPLRVDPANPRYFMDNQGKAILLTGSHTWLNFQDIGGSDPPPVFDYEGYLNFLTNHHHNFFRLWVWESSRWALQTEDENYWFAPMAYQRPGPELAQDGKPKYDLTQFNQAYFDRMRTRIQQAGERGIYVSVMLFNGWSSEKEKGLANLRNPWKSHPYNSANNINGINGDANNNDSGDDLYTLDHPEITAYQEAYVRKVIDTVNDLDNVLFEICNECQYHSQDWQYHIIDYIHTYEAGKPKQHMVGMTPEYPFGENTDLFNSPADWISPNTDFYNPQPTDGSKVILFDTDHLCGICGDREWAWKSFTRGNNPVFMDGYDGAGYGVGGGGFDVDNVKWEYLRQNLGYMLSLAERVDLSLMQPAEGLCSSGYCLANPAAQGATFIVYLPMRRPLTVDLSIVQETLSVEWLNPLNGQMLPGGEVNGGGFASFDSPFSQDSVLFLYPKSEEPPPDPTPAVPGSAFFPFVLRDEQKQTARRLHAMMIDGE